MKIIHYKLSLIGVDKDKSVMIKEDTNIMGTEHNNEHRLCLHKGTKKLKEDDYSLRPFSDGCKISFNIGKDEREYHFTLNEKFVERFEKFLEYFIDEEIRKIKNDFK